MVENIKGEMWKRVYDTNYFVSNLGRVKRIYKNAPEKLLNPYRINRSGKKGDDVMYIKIHRVPMKMTRLVYETFNGPIPKGAAVVKKDGTVTNLDVSNLVLMTNEQLGKIYGGRTTTRRLVIDNQTGKIYRGTRAAAAALFVSRQTVSSYCNNKIQKPGLDIAWLEVEKERE